MGTLTLDTRLNGDIKTRHLGLVLMGTLRLDTREASHVYTHASTCSRARRACSRAYTHEREL